MAVRQLPIGVLSYTIGGQLGEDEPARLGGPDPGGVTAVFGTDRPWENRRMRICDG
jgi:hypothetical protein